MTAGTGRTFGNIDIAVAGATGRVGSRFLQLLAAQQDAWRATGLRPRLVAVANSRHSLADRDGIAADAAAARLREAADALPATPSFAAIVARLIGRPLIVVDCTASAEIASLYPRWLAAGIDVVTPNKLASSGDRPLLHAVAAAQAHSGARLHDSTTVGAQLPLLATLRDLHRAGDRLERFEAVLSGTLSYVLGSLQRGAALSSAVREAVQQGYAEPNPARDLSGEDAARKLVILLRAFGHDIGVADIDCVPLVDAALLEETNAADLLSGLSSADEGWRARAALAEARRECWVYRASFDGTHARVAPERIALSHAFARLAPCENALILHSVFYRAAPLSIAGPGAGVDLTAAGVFADLIAAAQRHVARAETAQAVSAAA